MAQAGQRNPTTPQLQGEGQVDLLPHNRPGQGLEQADLLVDSQPGAGGDQRAQNRVLVIALLKLFHPAAQAQQAPGHRLEGGSRAIACGQRLTGAQS